MGPIRPHSLGFRAADVIMFSWSILTHVELLIYAAGLYLVALFANQERTYLSGGKLAVGHFCARHIP